MPSEFICSSCGKELQKSYALCYSCHTSPDLVRCNFIKRSDGLQCKLKGIHGNCIFHKSVGNYKLK